LIEEKEGDSAALRKSGSAAPSPDAYTSAPAPSAPPAIDEGESACRRHASDGLHEKKSHRRPELVDYAAASLIRVTVLLPHMPTTSRWGLSWRRPTDEFFVAAES
jgi:hypothetical protein